MAPFESYDVYSEELNRCHLSVLNSLICEDFSAN